LHALLLMGSTAMSKLLQIYYNAVFGAIGGLTGWWALGSLQTGSWNIWLASVAIGAGIGAAAPADHILGRNPIARTNRCLSQSGTNVQFLRGTAARFCAACGREQR
jgi:hypothetical protein